MSLELSTHKARIFQSILLVVLGFLGYSIADLCAKKLQEYYSVYQVLTVSSVFALSLSSLWLLLKHGPTAFAPKNLRLHLVRALFMLGTAYFMVRSLHTLPLADFYGIVFLMPFFAMILSVLFLKEAVGWHRWAAAAVGFAGILILAGPQFNTIGEGVICAALGAFCGATNMILMRKIGHDAPIPLYGVYPFLFILITMGTTLFVTDSYVPFRMQDVPLFMVHGPIIIFAITCTSLGFAKTPETSVIAPFQYTQALWGVTFGWLFFGNLPTATTWTGLVMIIAAGIYVAWREYHRQHPV